VFDALTPNHTVPCVDARAEGGVMAEKMSYAEITGAALEWARRRRNLSPEQLGKRARVQASHIKMWEAEESWPPFEKALTLAKVLRIPFGYLFLSDPIPDDLELPDLRTVGDKVPTKLSPEATEQIHSIVRKQEWLREYREIEHHKPINFVGKFTRSSAAELVAASIREHLKLVPATRRASTWGGYATRLMDRAEELGVMVIRSGIVKSNTRLKVLVEELRGFAIADEFAPLIFINGNDSVAARIFTIAHELAHIWIGSSGVTNANGVDEDSAIKVERLCNKIAAEVLVPIVEFNNKWDEIKKQEQRVNRLATHFRVSSLVIIRRALESGKIDTNTYFSMIREAKAQYKEARKSKGGDPSRNLYARNGHHLVEAVVSSVGDRSLTHRDASSLLNLSVRTVAKMLERGRSQ
jgi:Zn-dependent peptidase ImmA (M78 family)